MSTTLADPRRDHETPWHPSGPLVVAVGENGAHVLRAAAVLAPLFDQRVHVYSAVEPLAVDVVASEPIVIPPSFEEARRDARTAQVRARLAEVAREAQGWPLEVEHGDPVTSLVRRTRELDASLILIGIGRHKPVDRILGGEMTLRVLRRAHCPVLAVAGELPHRPRVIVVATDFSAQSMRGARTVLPLLDERATIHVVHVWQPSTTADPTVFAVEEEYARAISGRLARFVADLHAPPGVTIRAAVREGRCAAQIVAYATEHHADLIVAGRHGLNTMARFFVGSVTTALLRGATCSLLVTPETHVHSGGPSAGIES